MPTPSKKSAKRSSKPKKKVGRKRLNIDLVELEKLAGLQCTQKDVAAWFGCSPETIKHRLHDLPEYREAWEAGLGKGRVSIRRKQMRLADTNAAMAIFLGKQYLGQKDATEVEHSGGLTIELVKFGDK